MYEKMLLVKKNREVRVYSFNTSPSGATKVLIWDSANKDNGMRGWRLVYIEELLPIEE